MSASQDKIEYLEKLYEIKKQINALTGTAPTETDDMFLGEAYDAINELLSPVCEKCNVRAIKFITSAAALYDPAMAELPGGSTPYWTGEWTCPKCHRIVASGEKWWQPKLTVPNNTKGQ
jgi:hypothetical protein